MASETIRIEGPTYPKDRENRAYQAAAVKTEKGGGATIRTSIKRLTSFAGQTMLVIGALAVASTSDGCSADQHKTCWGDGKVSCTCVDDTVLNTSTFDHVFITGGGSSAGTFGHTDVYNDGTSTSGALIGLPVTMPEDGTLQSVSMYHEAGSGSMRLGVYNSKSGLLLGQTASTAVAGTDGWQTIDLQSPVTAAGGTTLILTWLYQTNPGIPYKDLTPVRYQYAGDWSSLGGSMPAKLDTGNPDNYVYSIYATYTTADRGVLRVHPGNSRYFTDSSGRAVYLTGSHTWYLIHYNDPTNPWKTDEEFEDYLDWMQEFGHNFVRLWTGWSNILPEPWKRTEPGGPFDMTQVEDRQVEDSYLDLVRRRVQEVQRRGMYCSVMFFGWASPSTPMAGLAWPGIPTTTSIIPC